LKYHTPVDAEPKVDDDDDNDEKAWLYCGCLFAVSNGCGVGAGIPRSPSS